MQNANLFTLRDGCLMFHSAIVSYAQTEETGVAALNSLGEGSESIVAYCSKGIVIVLFDHTLNP